MKKFNKSITICFVDFCKTFDSISRDLMFKILALYGIPPRIVGAIRAQYTNTTATVISPDREAHFFEAEAGVLQSDTLSLFLFIIVLNYALQISLDGMEEKELLLKPRQSSQHCAQYVTDLDFADDLALISHCIKDAESLLQALEKAANQVGLYCNENKTEFITTSSKLTELKSLNNISIKNVDDFKYLGSYIVDSQKDFHICKALAWDPFLLEAYLTNRHLEVSF
ncbi:uncharacterized protein LOC115212131 [Octopus sinensis]|uniref:Uncharacterized protein LOC115212131 n=1 Tax=Octopus sinensis TaxID=2607531 RepID=A0A6P7SER2_9MOLL|nr:uncharacterized protein LOC115212131 [Octopus sinensis]